jgi:3'-phosphoadenosine 5'-phosphosulfate sulfotransferase (PAPS reductase)/FAD synthetase
VAVLAARYCTSDHKRGQVRTLMTKLTAEVRARTGKQARILNCMGLRADESPARAKKVAFEFDESASNGRRHVDAYLPILDWTVEQVWARIKASGVRHHPAYDLGMGRLSCCFCVLAPKAALLLAAQHNPELADAYAAVEQKINHQFTTEDQHRPGPRRGALVEEARRRPAGRRRSTGARGCNSEVLAACCK